MGGVPSCAASWKPICVGPLPVACSSVPSVLALGGPVSGPPSAALVSGSAVPSSVCLSVAPAVSFHPQQMLSSSDALRNYDNNVNHFWAMAQLAGYPRE